MRFFAAHDSHGNIAVFTVCPPDAPPPAAPLTVEPGEEFFTEVEVPEGIIDLITNPESEQRVVETLKEYRVEEGKLVRKTHTD
jgi:hypothetical protein